jgi:SAM-dependent methyltransferase
MSFFDQYAQHYDAWYEKEPGKTIFQDEVECLRPFVTGGNGVCLEVGVGTGRFAQALSIDYGIDPSAAMLSFARDRGIKVCQAAGEVLPFRGGAFGGVLIVCTLCVLSDPAKVLREVRRVLQTEGLLTIGEVPAGSPWAEFYSRRGQKNHPVYRGFTFYTRKQVENLLAQAGFEVLSYRSALFQPPELAHYKHETPLNGYLPQASFIAIKSRRKE